MRQTLFVFVFLVLTGTAFAQPVKVCSNRNLENIFRQWDSILDGVRFGQAECDSAQINILFLSRCCGPGAVGCAMPPRLIHVPVSQFQSRHLGRILLHELIHLAGWLDHDRDRESIMFAELWSDSQRISNSHIRALRTLRSLRRGGN